MRGLMSGFLYLFYATVFCLSLGLCALTLKLLIPRLGARAAQPIYEGGPSWHSAKAGTPTMGGVSFILAVSLSAAIFGLSAYFSGDRESFLSVVLVAVFALLNALVGMIDDLKKLKRQKNAGLRPIEKLLLQGVIAAAFLTARAILFGDGTALSFSFGTVELGALYFPFAFILILGIVNCANLTDGIDGLASCVGFAIAVATFYLSAMGRAPVGVLSAAAMGGTVGFLFFNINPARIFMGDTGSLYLGALAVGSCFSLGNCALVIPMGGVYVIEGLSVIIQVAVYKLCRRRVFKMAPLHHHLERCGMGENKICVIAIIFTLAASLISFLAYGR